MEKRERRPKNVSSVRLPIMEIIRVAFIDVMMLLMIAAN